MTDRVLADSQVSVTADEVDFAGDVYAPKLMSDVSVQPEYLESAKILNVLLSIVYAVAFLGVIIAGAGLVIWTVLPLQTGDHELIEVLINQALVFGLPLLLCVGAGYGVKAWRSSQPHRISFVDHGGADQSYLVSDGDTAETIQDAIEARS